MKDRKSDHPISSLILNRWSPRSMTGESIDDATLFSLFEAARWAPSSHNNQPWRFLYAKRETAHWDLFFDLLVDFNKSWCVNAAVLGLSLSRTHFEKNNQPAPTHAYDTGAAWENLALEGSSRSLVVHGMQGFDYEKARTHLHVPPEYAVLAMFAIGKPAPKEQLPPDLQARETPSTRNPISHFAFSGPFPRK
jgi:nitroreductase